MIFLQYFKHFFSCNSEVMFVFYIGILSVYDWFSKAMKGFLYYIFSSGLGNR